MTHRLIAALCAVLCLAMSGAVRAQERSTEPSGPAAGKQGDPTIQKRNPFRSDARPGAGTPEAEGRSGAQNDPAYDDNDDDSDD